MSITPIKRCTLLLVLLASVVLFADAVSHDASANATGPAVTGGSHPWLDFTGTVTPQTQPVLYTVPSDRQFVLTSMCLSIGGNFNSDLNGFQVLEGSDVRVRVTPYTPSCVSNWPGDVLSRGAAKIVFAPSSEVKFFWYPGPTGPDVFYYVEGYLAHP